MSLLLEELLSMPIHQGTKQTISPSFAWEIYQYAVVGHGEDQEVEDVDI